MTRLYCGKNRTGTLWLIAIILNEIFDCLSSLRTLIGLCAGSSLGWYQYSKHVEAIVNRQGGSLHAALSAPLTGGFV